MNRKINLSYPANYDAELAAEIDNGCGPAGWKGRLIPDSIIFVSIRAACRIHDYDYHMGLTYRDKRIADMRFLTNMYSLIAAQPWWSRWLNPKRRMIARVYYTAVAHIGTAAFARGETGVREMMISKKDAKKLLKHYKKNVTQIKKRKSK